MKAHLRSRAAHLTLKSQAQSMAPGALTGKGIHSHRGYSLKTTPRPRHHGVTQAHRPERSTTVYSQMAGLPIELTRIHEKSRWNYKEVRKTRPIYKPNIFL